MTRTYFISGILLILVIFLAIAGCEKEKIIESTEYIHDLEYVTLPADTVYRVDTVMVSDSVIIDMGDTITVYDTVEIIEQHYDTAFMTDTITIAQCHPNEYLAIAALQYYSDPMVIEFISMEFGYNEGWIFYLSSFQLDLTKQSTDIYDIYGYIDYWTPDWSGYYPLEFLWRMTYTGGDPADPENWDITDPPALTAGYQPGLRLSPESRGDPQTLR